MVRLIGFTTTPPDDGFNEWCDEILDNITDNTYNKDEEWFEEYDGQCNKWLNELFRRGKDTAEATKMIERAFKIHIKKPIKCTGK